MDQQTVFFAIFVGSVLAILMAFIWIARRLGPKGHGQSGGSSDDVFSEEFREKLRERGIARFEHTIDKNSAFLQQDLHRLGDEITDYIKEKAGEILKDEFSDQKQSVESAQQHLNDAFAKIDTALEGYEKTMVEEFKKELTSEKERRLKRFEENMAEVVSNHVKEVLGSQLNISDQMKFILQNLEENKTAIIEDIKHEL